jgi:uncharacterized membrane protein YgcG
MPLPAPAAALPLSVQLVRRVRAQSVRRVPDRQLRRFMESAGLRSPRWFAAAGQIFEEQREIDEQDEDDVGQVANNTITVQATIAAVAPGSVTLTVQGQTLTVPLPAGLTLPASLVGQTVTVQLSLGGNDDQGDDDHGGDNGGGDHGGGGGDG